MRKVYMLIFLCCVFCNRSFTQFTPGNVVVVRVADGSPLSNSSTAVFLDEYTAGGAFVQTISIPNTTAGSRLTMGGTSTSEGMVSLSGDGRYLLIGGYDAAVGVASIASTTSAVTNRVLGRIDFNENIDLSTRSTDGASAGNIRSVASNDGSNMWMSGSTGGVRYMPFGTVGTSTQLNGTLTNSRALNVGSEQLYVSFGAGNQRGPNYAGTGLPTAGGQTFTLFPGFTAGATGSPTNSPYQYVLFDANPTVAGYDLMYIADDDLAVPTNGLWKLTFDGSTWTARGHLTGRIAGLTGYRDCAGSTHLYVSTATGTSNNSVYKITDNSTLLANITGDGTAVTTTGTVFIAAVGNNTAFRGLAMAPAQGYTVTGAQTIPTGDYNIIRVKSGGVATLTGNIVVFDKIIVESGGTLDMGTHVIQSAAGKGSSFEVQSGGALKIGSPDGITASAALGNVQTCFRIYNSGANYEYTGATPQNSGDGLPTSISGILTISNTSGIATSGVTLSQATTVTGNLTLNSGKLTTTSTNLITLNYTGLVVSGASPSSFVSGPISKVVGTDQFVFPVGIGSIYAPVALNNGAGQAAGDQFTAEYIRANPQSVHGPVVDPSMDHVSYVEYWTVTRNTGSASKKISLVVNYTSFCYDLSRTYIGRWDALSNEWETEGGTVTVTGPPSPPYVSGTIESVNNVSTFGDFTFITDLPFASNPLPVKLISFTAKKQSATKALLEWELAERCSKDAVFQIEKSGDGRNFHAIGQVQGSETNVLYFTHDNNLGQGITYYRLKAMDIDGSITYSRIVVIINGSEGLVITSIAPNPVSDQAKLILNTARAGRVDMLITDIAGRPLRRWTATVGEGSNTITVDTRGLAGGIYHLSAMTPGSNTGIRFVKQ